jgi:RNA polymerase sigma factor (sigma-70 family)
MSRNEAYHQALSELRRRAALEERETPDRVLLERFLGSQDEPAFALLVRRHGPLVLARRLLHDAHGAEDVFQAAFLVLARKAGSIGRRESVAGWLYAVTWRLASRLRRSQGRNRTTPVPEPAAPTDTPAAEAARRELALVLDEEIQQLPEPLRSPIVLCYLEELTQDEAAGRLGWSKGTLRRRLERARELLRARLTGRGATLALALWATAFPATGMAASVSSDQAAELTAAGRRLAPAASPWP